ncbi:dsDNA nuclease domain-containing protein [Paraliobacillus sediminis]|uniref:dsDNA nuclease domain-containing protein n=1 Tax=Paraliobacillus sediminis TaxID=1885916 RepID=UPI000E3DDCBC|nr:dsDNA nuclease domain-containing protein [Paraliobacillus sediminis]
MILNSVTKQLLAIVDEEKGGENALDGFEFQISSAIYLIFNELKDKKDFALIYEKIEDFIIVSDKIHLYQAKSVSNNITPKLLYKPSRITKNDSTGLSIIEKMYINYNKVKKEIGESKVECHLLVCETNEFSKKLSKDLKDIKNLKLLCFQELSEGVKQEIINATVFDNYEWARIYAARLIPKSRHEEVTRIFIEDTINEIFGDNKINSTALYNALTYEIRRIRKNKSELTNTFLTQEIHKYTSLENDVSFSDCAHLLNDKDRRSIQISLMFSEINSFLQITNHPLLKDYQKISEYFNLKSMDDLYEIFDKIKNNDYFKDICIRLNDHEIKVLILLFVVKEIV